MKTGLILNNIGTPDSPSSSDVKKYLDQFLMDPDVIPLPYPIRWFLVKVLITPRRAPASAEKYQSIWRPEGSPLLIYSQKFAEDLQAVLGSSWSVQLGMRYGQPSLESALICLREQNVEKLILAPLYPQYAEATTGSAWKETQRLLNLMKWKVSCEVIPEFHQSLEFLAPQANLIRKIPAEHTVFSFHGLPENQVCRRPGCLDHEVPIRPQSVCEPRCYRFQCLQTAFDLAEQLGLQREQWSFSFQSRLGPTKWIGPSTEEVLATLGRKKIKSVAIACPSFVADCLETLEEIGMGGAEDFHRAGGGDYRLVPCLNHNLDWIEGFSRLVSTYGKKQEKSFRAQ